VAFKSEDKEFRNNIPTTLLPLEILKKLMIKPTVFEDIESEERQENSLEESDSF